MRRLSISETIKKIRIEIVLILCLASMASIAGLIYPSNYSPLLFLGMVIGAVILVALFIRPVFAFYPAMFIVLLPVGILPLEIHSQLNRALTVAAFGIWAVAVLMKRQRIYWSGTATVMVAFLVWSLITTLWAKNFDWAETLVQAYALRFLLFIFLMPNFIRTKKDLDGMFITLALVGWALMAFSVFALAQSGYTPGSRFKLLGVNENDAGTLVQITLLGVLWLTTQLSKRKQFTKIFFAVIYLLLTVVIVFASGSRGSAISFAITVIAFLFWRTTRSWSLMCLFLLVLAVIFSPSLFITTIERFLLQTSDSQSLLGGREGMWKAAWEMITENPMGVGIGNARLSILPYLNMSNYLEGVSAHNPILVIWSETGLLGILLYLGVLISALLAFIKQYFCCKRINICDYCVPYYAFVTSVFLGYMASWFKGGGMEMAHSYFFMIALLLIPSCLELDNAPSKQIRSV